MDSRIIGLALRTLEDVAAQAEIGIVERQWGHRLALQLLVHAGIALPWQAKHFWEVMAAPIRDTTFPHFEDYIRTTQLNGALENWHYAARIERADVLIRGRWAMAHAPEFIDLPTNPMDGRPMCNRAKPGRRETIVGLFDVKKVRTFNDGPAIMHPRDPGPVVLLADGEMVLDQMTWGFPVVLKGRKGLPLKPKPVNNARFDKLKGFWKWWASQPQYRCLIPTEKYAEAVGTPGKMTVTWLSLKSAPVFAWAGLWGNSDEWGPVFTGVMTDAAPGLEHIHDRSPVILAPEDWHKWLTAPLDDLYCFNRPWPAADVKVEATGVLWKDGGNIARPDLVP